MKHNREVFSILEINNDNFSGLILKIHALFWTILIPFLTGWLQESLLI